MPEVKAAPSALNTGRNKGGAYQDRDKPAQIRYSNISAAKGRIKHFYGQRSGASLDQIQLWVRFSRREPSSSVPVPLFIVASVLALHSLIAPGFSTVVLG